MSGPIIRKYGFANFDKIFGERELKHGIEGEPEPADAAKAPEDRAATSKDQGSGGQASAPENPTRPANS